MKNLREFLLQTLWKDFLVHSRSGEVLPESVTLGKLCSFISPLRVSKQMLCFLIVQLQLCIIVKKARHSPELYVLCLSLKLQTLGKQKSDCRVLDLGPENYQQAASWGHQLWVVIKLLNLCAASLADLFPNID